MKYLIDFENVANNGFDGLPELRPTDELLIFYSEQHSTISIPVHQALEKSQVKKTYMPIKSGGKNALDFQLVTWLGFEISQNDKEHFVIISKDTGFDVVVDFWKKRGINVSRNRSLQGTKAFITKVKKSKSKDSKEVKEKDAKEKESNESKTRKKNSDKAAKVEKRDKEADAVDTNEKKSKPRKNRRKPRRKKKEENKVTEENSVISE